jgi:hypothetical protein
MDSGNKFVRIVRNITDQRARMFCTRPRRAWRAASTLWFVICLTGGWCIDAGEGTALAAGRQTSVYVFQPEQSTILQTGGFAGVHWTYRLEGQFRLTVDGDARTASFDRVDARATDDSPYQRTLDPNEVFHMTGLTGTVVDETSIRFEGKAGDESSVLLTLTLTDGTVTLQGQTTPPPHSADFFVFALDAVARRAYAGGAGTADEPYLIGTADQMNAIGATPDDWDKHFQLQADIDLSTCTAGTFTIIGSSYTQPFRGTFDGAGHVIRNLVISDSAGRCFGLFGTLGATGRVSNLELAQARVHGNTYVGALVGYNAGGSILNCKVTAEVHGIGYTGGIAGISIDNAFISHCCADVRVVGDSYETGGIAGANSSSTIVRCTVAGTVTGVQSTGGITGRQDWGAVLESSSTCSMTGGRWTGGLVGRNAYSTVAESFATGDVSGVDGVGGLVAFSDAEIRDCWAAARVSGYSSVGGLLGENIYGFVFRSYSRSVVNGKVEKGGLVGRQQGTCLYEACFWDSDADTLPPSVEAAGIYARPSAELKLAGTYTQGGWDFAGETENGTEDIWWMFEGRDYPRLWWEQVLGDDFGDGKAEPLWTLYQPEPQRVWLKEVNGRLEVEAVAETEDVDAIYIANGWRLDAAKDFALRVDFHFSQRGPGDGRLTLGVIPTPDPAGMQWAELGAGSFDSGPFYLCEVRDGAWVQEQEAARFSDDGTLFMSYNSSADELYFSHTGYGKSNAWQTVSGLPKGRWATESVYVILSGGSEGMALTAGDAWLDNFVVNAGMVEPSATSATDAGGTLSSPTSP